MGRKPQQSSTSYSAKRYAHPFFVPEPPELRSPHKGNHRMADWHEKQLGPIPKVRGNGRIDLTDIIGAEGVKEISDLGEIRFHALGDSGVGDAHEAEMISDSMAEDYRPGAGALNPAFLFHLGDIIYGNDKTHNYGQRFYKPYRRYPGKIIAIPGNHDGEVKAQIDAPSLKAFEANFCATQAAIPDQASGSGIYRETMTLPGVYWMLDAPLARFIGLYSNLVENPGFLEGGGDGAQDKSQIQWLQSTLRHIKSVGSGERKALILATHHPLFSAGGHSGSDHMRDTLDRAFEQADVWPDLVLSAHSHNYQRYTRRIAGKSIPYIVAGTGGMKPQKVPDATGEPAEKSSDTTYDGSLASLGYLFVSVSAAEIKTEFWPVDENGATRAYDPVSIDLTSHTVRRG